MQSLNLKKFFLYLLIASVALCALLGIGVLLFGSFSNTELKILLTTLIVTMTSILGLACGAFLETGRGKILPVAGIGLAVLAAMLWTVFIWGNVGNERFILQITFSATILAASCSHLSLLSIARLDRKFRWSLPAAHFSVWSLAAILIWIVWANLKGDSELVTRIIGVLSIVVAALTITMPIFHWLSNNAPNTEKIDAEIERLKQRIEELKKQKAEFSDDQPETEFQL
jgi:hypothetical protein